MGNVFFLMGPGMVMIVAGAFAGDNLLLTFAILFCVAWTSVFNLSKWTLGILLLSLVTKLVLGDSDVGLSTALYAAGWTCFYLGANALCHRCLTHVSYSRSKYSWPRHCENCGRDRSDIRPFSYQTRLEVWDGEYSDEGGGLGDYSYRVNGGAISPGSVIIAI